MRLAQSLILDQIEKAESRLWEAWLVWKAAYDDYQTIFEKLSTPPPLPEGMISADNPALVETINRFWRATEEYDSAKENLARLQARYTAELRRQQALWHGVGPRRYLQPRVGAPRAPGTPVSAAPAPTATEPGAPSFAGPGVFFGPASAFGAPLSAGSSLT
jgi:hypothetical protein